MPIFNYQCQKCGWIEDDVLVDRHDSTPDIECVICASSSWKKHYSYKIAEPTRLKHDNSSFPMRMPFQVHSVKNGKIVSEFPVAINRSHMERLMKHHGYVFVDENSRPTNSAEPKMPKNVEEMRDHPAIRRYLDLKKSGRIPESMALTEQQLKERFEV